MSQQVLDALRKLDVNNDAQWTIEGQPKLDTVKQLSGDNSITRDSLHEIAPGFNRESYRAYLAQGNANASTGSGGGVGSTTSTSASATSEPAEAGSENREAEIKALAEKIAGEDETILELQRVQSEAGAKLKEAQQRRDTLVLQHEKLIPPEKPIDVIQKYLESRKQLLQQRGEMMTAIRESGVDLRALNKLTSRAPVDNAMRNRRTDPRHIPPPKS